MLGKHHTEETKRKIKQNHKICSLGNNSRAIPIIVGKKQFTCIKEAYVFYNTTLYKFKKYFKFQLLK